MPFEVERDRVTDAILRLDPRGARGRRMGREKEQGEVAQSEADHPTRRGPHAAAAGGQAREAVDRHRDLPVRSPRAREGARRGGAQRRDRPRPHRPHQPRRRKEPQKARDAAAGCRRHRRAHGRRPHALSRQDDDRRRHAARARLQLHAARHRAKPELRHRDARQAARQGSLCALRGRLHPAAIHPGHDRFVVSPESSRDAADRFPQPGEETVSDLRPQGVGPP